MTTEDLLKNRPDVFGKKHILITGHYGTGKSNIAVNLALASAKTKKTILVDLDIVNPYFRSADNTDILEKAGVRVLTTNFANTNIDAPSLPAAIYSVFSSDATVIWDIGGDDAGAIALGRFADKIKEDGYSCLYVINKFRPLTETAADMTEYLTAIEETSRLKITGIINNSNLGSETDISTLESGLKEADSLVDRTGIQLISSTADKRLKAEGFVDIEIFTVMPF